MASYTDNLNLLKKDPATDGSNTFNIQTMLNDNWDKLDAAVGAARSAEEYDDGAAYAAGDYCTRDGKLYKCVVTITAGEAWNTAHWAETTLGAELSGKAAAVHADNHATGGADPLTPAQIGAATTLTLTVTVPTGWTASGGYYYKQVSVPGMLATDNPIADILPGSDNAANKLYAEAWSKVQSIDILDDGTVKLWANSVPTISFSLQFKITRTGNETGQGKCILAGHPPVGGQIGYGTYTGNGAVSRTISLGITPKWVLVLCKGAFVGEFGTNGANGFGGLALAGSPAAVFGSLNCVAIVPGGFQVSYDSISGSYYYARTNDTSTTYNYIYGT